MKRYILHPGFVRSRTDGGIHYIGAVELAQLYGLALRDCVVKIDWRNGEGRFGEVHLYPRIDGNYVLPNE